MKKYQIIYADPPWLQTKSGLRKVRPNQSKNLDYPTLTSSEITKVLSNICGYQEPNILFLWTIDSFLYEAECIAKSLNYKLHARIIWDKENGIAPSFDIRFSHEYLLWFFRSPFLPIATEQRGKWRDVIREKSTIHSKKPIKAYEMIEAFYPTQNKLELFARQKTSGWDVWGNEVESDIELVNGEFRERSF